MKNFDIENLERKNIYKVPDSLFEDIQKTVMQHVQKNEEEDVKSTTVVKLNWWMAAAASVVLLFGLGWVFGDDITASEAPHIDTLVKTDLPHSAAESQYAYNTLKSDISSVEVHVPTQKSHEMEETPTKTLVSTTNKDDAATKNVNNKKSELSEEQMNVYLDVLSSKEISEIAQNSVSDVYLDLYN